MKLLVLTDLHCFSDPTRTPVPSYLCSHKDYKQSNPLTELVNVITKDKINFDAVLVLGDYCDKADTEALKYTWEKLNALKAISSKNELIPIPGNHDHDSRFISSSDPKANLRTLSPKFPLPDPLKVNEFFANHVTSFTLDHLNFILTNTCCLHGYTEQLKRGQITDMMRQIIIENAAKESESLNVLLLHHAPRSHRLSGESAEDHAEGGDELLEEICSSIKGKWVILHGHKHNHRLRTLCGVQPIPIFSLDSFAAVSDAKKIMRFSDRRFYVIEFKEDWIQEFGAVGSYSSWSFSPHGGWKKYQPIPGISKFGFGGATNLYKTASEIAKQIAKGDTWSNLLNQVNELQFLEESQVRELFTILRDTHQITVTFNTSINEYELERP